MKAHRDSVAFRLAAAVVILLAIGQGIGSGAEERVGEGAGAAAVALRAITVQTFNRYVTGVESENLRALQRGPFLWIDGLDDSGRNEAIAKLKEGEVQMRRLSTKAQGRNPDVPEGMIHDWEGIVFIPGVKLDVVLRLLQDYNRHATYFAPDVEKSRIESRDGDHYRVFMRFRRQKIVTVVLDTEHDVRYFHDSPLRAHSRSTAIRIAQVERPSEADEKEKPPGDDDGFLWRMETWWRMEERDGGVYVQNEAVTLTRDIPTGFGWLIEPFITKIPKETLAFTLQSLRKAVLIRSR